MRRLIRTLPFLFKTLPFLLLAFFSISSATLPACAGRPNEDQKQPTVAILLFNGVEIIDYSGPWEVFGEAGFKVHTVAETAAPITTVFGQKVTADYTFDNSPRADILLVPGGAVGNQFNDPKVIKWVQDSARDATHVMSVCNGAFILAKAGLLDGLTATTVHHSIDKLAQFSPKTKVVYDQRYVDNGKIITTAGLSSGIDGAFHLVEKILGRGRAETTALGMEYRWEPESKYARAAFADRYLPDFDGLQGDVLSAVGDVDHWEIRALVWQPASAAEILETAGKEVVNNTRHTRGAVTLLPRDASASSKQEVRWKFTDEQGRGWNGAVVAEPSPEEKGKFFVTLKLDRDTK